MFIINLSYKKEIDEVERVLPAHIEFLNQYYKKGNFICSGRKNPRIGGVILCNANNRDEVEQIIKEDPFNIEEIANYEVIEFMPTKYNDDFKDCIK